MSKKHFAETKAPVKYLPGEKFTHLNINSKTKYLISTKGRIYSYYSDRIVTGRLTSGVRVFEYRAAPGKKPPLYALKDAPRVINDRGHISITIQHLMALTFINTPRPFVVAHKNYDKQDNSIENILCFTINESFAYSRASPRYVVPRENGKKLNIKDIEKIKTLLKAKRAGEDRSTIKEIAALFGVAQMQIYRIQNGESWKHAGPPVKQKEEQNKLSPAQVKKIKKLLNRHTGRKIAKLFNITPSRVSKIKNGKTYNND